MKVLNVAIDDNVKAELEKYAKETDMKIKKLVELALIKFLKLEKKQDA